MRRIEMTSSLKDGREDILWTDYTALLRSVRGF